jgi:hypothetical protein
MLPESQWKDVSLILQVKIKDLEENFFHETFVCFIPFT